MSLTKDNFYWVFRAFSYLQFLKKINQPKTKCHAKEHTLG